MPIIGLLGRALRRRDDAVAAQRLTSGKAAAYSAARQGGRGRDAELVGRAQDERLHLAPVGAERERMPADRVLPPLPRPLPG